MSTDPGDFRAAMGGAGGALRGAMNSPAGRAAIRVVNHGPISWCAEFLTSFGEGGPEGMLGVIVPLGYMGARVSNPDNPQLDTWGVIGSVVLGAKAAYELFVSPYPLSVRLPLAATSAWAAYNMGRGRDWRKALSREELGAVLQSAGYFLRRGR